MATPAVKRILIAPLDWGLGHTARCVPIIRYIQRQGHIPIVAGNDWQRSFIEKTFGDINFIHLEGYNVTYSNGNRYARIGILSQIPRLSRTINTEHKWLLQQAKELRLDGVISDNRYGLYHAHIPSVILTHQLQIQTGMGKFMDHAARKMHYKYLNRFGETWVVDQPGFPNLSGELAHPAVLPARAKYIGLLSQFDEDKSGTVTDGSLLILLSGPEPQRSKLSEILWQQVQGYKGKVVFVEGSESVTLPSFIPPHIIYHKQLTNETLAPLIHNAEMVICRSGYSTIMDLVALRKKAILIPTPGQTEQEYLGKHFCNRKIFYTAAQKNFDLSRALMQSLKFTVDLPNYPYSFSTYKKAFADWLAQL